MAKPQHPLRQMNPHQQTDTRLLSRSYVCPMHPEVRQGEPGRCPMCGMTLVQEQVPKQAPAEDHTPDHLEMLRQMREKWLWTNATVALLGVWLISSPLTFGYTRPALARSDVVSGLLLAIFSVLA